jgi:hypothetical protein
MPRFTQPFVQLCSMQSSHAPLQGSGRFYSFPVIPFPWPETLTCGEPYINRPAGVDAVLYSTFQAEVAVPERMIEVGPQTNVTKDALGMLFTKPKSIETSRAGPVTRSFIPLFRTSFCVLGCSSRLPMLILEAQEEELT